jgi:hypothetical protein
MQHSQEAGGAWRITGAAAIAAAVGSQLGVACQLCAFIAESPDRSTEGGHDRPGGGEARNLDRGRQIRFLVTPAAWIGHLESSSATRLSTGAAA